MAMLIGWKTHAGSYIGTFRWPLPSYSSLLCYYCAAAEWSLRTIGPCEKSAWGCRAMPGVRGQGSDKTNGRLDH